MNQSVVTEIDCLRPAERPSAHNVSCSGVSPSAAAQIDAAEAVAAEICTREDVAHDADKLRPDAIADDRHNDQQNGNCCRPGPG
eukprot:CAMPEP_0195327660 /NCGR_PEP_ID=MMETSP0708-20121125/10375_1 /TAXON_ID=33640 /ORGANISM="Asterionellopsis glacialis, Strain CCMP134" /LENGTH=83 /DNA_ID=CAMNT_0040395391 /DNA_START=451 /DNA_END=701 /DNA_ORIENTATION=-